MSTASSTESSISRREPSLRPNTGGQTTIPLMSDWKWCAARAGEAARRLPLAQARSTHAVKPYSLRH